VNESEELPARTALTATDAAEGRPVSVPPAMRPDARAAISLTREACVPEEGSLWPGRRKRKLHSLLRACKTGFYSACDSCAQK